eukprot:2332868-Prymnesium_polylepis.1
MFHTIHRPLFPIRGSHIGILSPVPCHIACPDSIDGERRPERRESNSPLHHGLRPACHIAKRPREKSRTWRLRVPKEVQHRFGGFKL